MTQSRSCYGAEMTPERRQQLDVFQSRLEREPDRRAVYTAYLQPYIELNWQKLPGLSDRQFWIRFKRAHAKQLANDDLRRDVTRLITHCDRKIDQCHSLGE